MPVRPSCLYYSIPRCPHFSVYQLWFSEDLNRRTTNQSMRIQSHLFLIPSPRQLRRTEGSGDGNNVVLVASFARCAILHRTGSSLQLSLIRGVFSYANDINLFLMIFMSLHCKLVPIQCQEYEYGLLQYLLCGFTWALAGSKSTEICVLPLISRSENRLHYFLKFPLPGRKCNIFSKSK